MLTHLSKGGFAKAERYVMDSGLELSSASRQARRFYSAMFSTMRYTIVDSEISGDEAKVTVVVTMADMEALSVQTSAEVLDGTFSGNSASLYHTMLAQLKEEVPSYVTYTVTVPMTKEGGRWKVNMSAGFANAITGGMRQLVGY